MPPGGGLVGHPARGQVRLAAGHVRAAEIDADRPVGRGAPRVHRRLARGRAGVEPEPGRDRARAGARAQPRRRRGRASPRADRWQRAQSERAADDARVASATSRVASTRPRRSCRRYALPGRGRRPAGRLEQQGLGAPDRRCRAALARRRAPQVQGVAIKPHARRGIACEIEHRPGARNADQEPQVADELDRRLAGGGRGAAAEAPRQPQRGSRLSLSDSRRVDPSRCLPRSRRRMGSRLHRRVREDQRGCPTTA